MQAEAIVVNPCFYKGFFPTTDSVNGRYSFTSIHIELEIWVNKKTFLVN